MAPVKASARRPLAGRSLKPFRRAWLWVGLWCLGIAAVVYFSLVPPQDLPPVPEGSDKVEHFVAYALLAAGAVQLFARRASLLSACIALALLGVLLEYLQGRTGLGRSMDPLDALANTLGVLTGLATVLTPLRDLLLRMDRPRTP